MYSASGEHGAHEAADGARAEHTDAQGGHAHRQPGNARRVRQSKERARDSTLELSLVRGRKRCKEGLHLSNESLCVDRDRKAARELLQQNQKFP